MTSEIRSEESAVSTASRAARSAGWRIRLVAGALLSICILIFSGWMLRSRSTISEAVPELPLSELAPAVQQLLEKCRSDVIRNPSSGTAWGELGMTLLAYQLDNEAMRCLQAATGLAPEQFRWHYCLGLSAAAVDRPMAIAAYRKAAELRPRDSLAPARLGELLLAEGLVTEAAEALERSVKNSPTPSARVLQAWARVRLKQQDFQEAKRLAELALQKAPQSRMVLQVLAQAEQGLGNGETASHLAQQMLSLQDFPVPWDDPHAAMVFACRLPESSVAEDIQSLREQGQFDRALNLARTHYEEHREDTSVGLALAELYAAAGIPGQARDVLLELKQLSPELAEVHFRIGISCFLQQQWPDAVEAFRQTLQLSPDNELAAYNLGHCYLRLNQPDEALEAFRETLRISPEHVLSRINLAKLLLQQGQEHAARTELQTVLRLAPDNQEARALLTTSPDEKP